MIFAGLYAFFGTAEVDAFSPLENVPQTLGTGAKDPSRFDPKAVVVYSSPLGPDRLNAPRSGRKLENQIVAPAPLAQT